MKLMHVLAALSIGALAVIAMPAAAQEIAANTAVANLENPMPALGAEFEPQRPIIIDGEASVPWGDWLSEFIKGFAVIAGSAALWLLRRIPSKFGAVLDMIAGMTGQGRANELLEKAIVYGINTTAGAARGKVLTVKVGNEVLERAFEYALRHAPKLVTKLGGDTMLREKIIARLDLDESAAVPSPRPPAEQLIDSAT